MLSYDGSAAGNPRKTLRPGYAGMNGDGQLTCAGEKRRRVAADDNHSSDPGVSALALRQG